MRRGKQKVRLSSSVTEIADNGVQVVRKTKRATAGHRRVKPIEKDPLALPKRKSKPAVPTKAARKQPAEPAEYEVEKIVAHKQQGRQLTFRIRWKGWAAKDDTWQLESDLNCAAILKKYKATIKDTPAAASPRKSASPKKRGRPPGATAKKDSPRKSVAGGRVTKKKGVGRPKLSAAAAGKKVAAKSPKKKQNSNQKRGRKPKEWEVEEVVAVRTTDAGKEEFYIKWKGYSSEENTWEPAENVGNCDRAIERYRKAQNGGGGDNNGELEDDDDSNAPLATALNASKEVADDDDAVDETVDVPAMDSIAVEEDGEEEDESPDN